MYHSDIKNANIVVIFDYINRVTIKLIDLGVATFDYTIIEGLTTGYMPSIAKAIEENKK